MTLEWHLSDMSGDFSFCYWFVIYVCVYICDIKGEEEGEAAQHGVWEFSLCLVLSSYVSLCLVTVG